MLTLSKKLVAIAAVSSIFTVSPLQQAMAAELVKPNFVTIIIDDMGYSDLGAFGGEASTPNLDKLAAEGTILSNFYAGATSSPSRAMLFTGKDNHPAGVGNMSGSLRDEQRGQPGYDGVLSLDALPFPQVLQDNGYQTMMVGKWHMGDEESHYAVNRGFTETRALLLPGGNMNYMSDASGNYVSGYPAGLLGDRVSMYLDSGVETDFSNIAPMMQTSEYYTNEALTMVDDWASAGTTTKPFYLNMSYIAPHAPWQAPKDVIDKYTAIYSQGWEKLREQRFNNLKSLGYLPADSALPAMPENIPAWDTLSDRRQQLEARRVATYTAMIEVLDDNVGRLIADLKAKGVYDNTVFFVYSDNGGEYFAPGAGSSGFIDNFVMGKFPYTMANYQDADGNFPEVDGLSDADFTALMDNLGGPESFIGPNRGWATVANMPFNEYKGDTYDGGVRGAAFVSYPKAKTSGLSYGCLQSVQDIAPTILGMAGAPYPDTFNGKPNAPMQGISMEGIFNGQFNCNPERALGFEWDGTKGLRQGNWKLSQRWSEEKLSLFNVWDDPFERNDLSAENPAKMAEMLDLYKAYAEENNIIEVNPKVIPDLAISDPTSTAKLRAGTVSLDSNGEKIGGFATDANVKPGAKVRVEAEIRPAAEDVGLSGAVAVSLAYKLPGFEPLFFSITKNEGIVVTNGPALVPFTTFANLPPMIVMPVYEGILSEIADITLSLSYGLLDNNGIFIPDSLVSSTIDTPMKLNVSNTDPVTQTARRMRPE
ncbi:MAG: sulfatase-like hydrolase/transferase [Pseudomonadota bacterium]